MTVIEVEKLTKDYGHGRGIFDVSFDVAKGETLGFLGPNGAGKSTTMRHLMGFSKPHSGHARISGMECADNYYKILRSVGYLPGEVALPEGLNGWEFIRMMQGLRKNKNEKRVQYLLDKFRLNPEGNVKKMSIGEKRKLAVVTAFMDDPDILLLDEPTSGLDPLMRDTLIELILEQKKRGATVLMSSHIFKELEDTCDRVAFIHNGKFIDRIDREMYDPNMPKQYRIGFADEKEYKKFAALSGFNIVRKNDKYHHLILTAANDEINKLFKQLSMNNVRYIKYIPYTLEMYYIEVIEKGGKI